MNDDQIVAVMRITEALIRAKNRRPHVLMAWEVEEALQDANSVHLYLLRERNPARPSEDEIWSRLNVSDTWRDRALEIVPRCSTAQADALADLVMEAMDAAVRDLLSPCERLVELADEGAYIDLADVRATPISRDLRDAIERARDGLDARESGRER